MIDLCLIVVAPASCAQNQIWLDESIRSQSSIPQVAINNISFLYRLLDEHTLSINQFRLALQQVVLKHQSLCTSVIFDTTKNALFQRIIDFSDERNKELFIFIESAFESDEQLQDIIYTEKRDSRLFDLTHGLVFRCHIVYYKQISSNNLLSHKDAIIFNFHHASFDLPSMDIFLHDLNQTYNTGQLITKDDTTLRYLDCK
jgi:hypothetical protein